MKQVFPQYLLFILGGGTGALINISITYTLTEFFQIWYLLSFVIGGICNILFNFLFHVKITFQASKDFFTRLMKFFIVSITYGVVSIALVKFLVDTLQLYYLVAVVSVIGALSIINFLINKHLIFQNKDFDKPQVLPAEGNGLLAKVAIIVSKIKLPIK